MFIKSDLRSDSMELQSVKLFNNAVEEKQNDIDVMLAGNEEIDSNCGSKLPAYLGCPST